MDKCRHCKAPIHRTPVGWTHLDGLRSCMLTAGPVSGNAPFCLNHIEIQHRDAQPPWCGACGWNHGRPAVVPRQIKVL